MKPEAEPKILLVSHDVDLLRQSARQLREAGFTPMSATSVAQALEFAAQNELFGAFVEHHLVGTPTAHDLVVALRQRCPGLLISHMGSMSLFNLKAFDEGHDAILPSPPRKDWLIGIAQDFLSRWRSSRGASGDGKIATSSPPVLTAADSRAPAYDQASLLVGELLQLRGELPTVVRMRSVLITGPMGSGKDQVAMELHRISGREKVLVLDCSVVHPDRAQSELFGHEKGAFTGADRQKIGFFEAAHGQTLFLDEIHNLPWEVQGMLLRALSSGDFSRMGSFETRTSKPYVICATNRDLVAEVEANRFRGDLYSRLAQAMVEVPSLDEHRTDIPLLVQHLTALICQDLQRDPVDYEPSAIALLSSVAYPGNVRELKSVLAKCINATPLECHTVPYDRVQQELLIKKLSADAKYLRPLRLQLEELEERVATVVLGATGNNQRRAAAILGVHRTWLRKLIARRSPLPTQEPRKKGRASPFKRAVTGSQRVERRPDPVSGAIDLASKGAKEKG